MQTVNISKKYSGYRTSKKLTGEDANRIRELYDSGLYTQSALAKMFGVNQSTISSIVGRNPHTAVNERS